MPQALRMCRFLILLLVACPRPSADGSVGGSWKDVQAPRAALATGAAELPERSPPHSAKAELERFRKLFEFIEAWSGCSMFYLPKLAPSRACFRKMQLKQCDSSIGVKQA